LHGLNTFDDDNELGIFEEAPKRPPRERARAPQRSSGGGGGPRRSGPAGGSNGILRLAGLVALGIVIIFGFVLWISSCSGQSTQNYTSYINAMQPLAQNSAQVGKDFAKALGTPGLTMQTFQDDLATWSKQQQADYIAAQRLQPPGVLQDAHAQALAAFQLRYNSLSQLASTLTVAQQKHAGPAIVAAALASDAQLLSASDVVWEQLYKLPVAQILTARNIGNVIVPASRIVTNPDIVSAPQLATFYQRLGTPTTGHGGGVTGTHGSDLIGTNAVENGQTTALSKTSTVEVSVGPSLVINVVFLNSGDYPEVRIPVTLTVKAGDKSLYSHRQTVAQIASGAQATVPFTNLQLPPSSFSRNATIFVKIGQVPGEARLDNNVATYPVLFRIAPS
jgi:hypothetical protein